MPNSLKELGFFVAFLCRCVVMGVVMNPVARSVINDDVALFIKIVVIQTTMTDQLP